MKCPLLIGSIAAPALLTACVSAPRGDDPMPDGPAMQTCDAAPVQGFVGRLSNADRNAEIQRLTGARTLRWIGPGMAVTMDYREDRVNVYYDAQQMVTQISCG